MESPTAREVHGEARHPRNARAQRVIALRIVVLGGAGAIVQVIDRDFAESEAVEEAVAEVSAGPMPRKTG